MREIITNYIYQGQPTKALKIYFDYDEFEVYKKKDPKLSRTELVAEIFKDDAYKTIPHLIIGDWGETYDPGINTILQNLILNKERLAHLESMFIGDISQEESEVSWITQGEYAPLLEHYPALKSLTIKGSSSLSFQRLQHANLTHLEIISGGLPSSVINKISQAELPKLESLRLYFGTEAYGFDGNIETIKPLLKRDLFPNLTHLGLLNSEVQDEIVQALIASDIVAGLHSLDLSMGTLTDIGGQTLLDNIERFKHLNEITLHYHYLSNEMIQSLTNSVLKVKISDQQEAEDYDDDGTKEWRSPMLTE